MRKSFTILTSLIVCAITALGSVSGSANDESSSTILSAVDVANRISEARKILQTQSLAQDEVRLAVLDANSDELGVVTLLKDEFLTREASVNAFTDSGREVTVEVLRANGVNTAVNVTDRASGELLVPLLVQYPIVKNGAITEIGYYSSAHPALVSPELTENGHRYIRTMLDQAAAKLAGHGVIVARDIVNVAEHLCVVEHTDHKRFQTEDETELFPEILALYALNRGNTYRYSVSTAGAGGMIQMIPRTYAATRQAYPEVGLNPDFVGGMRDHANALQAMLLYMHDTWNGLAKSSEVQAALLNGTATKTELLAAGYNSNPTRLPSYLKKGGTTWRTLIPAETQMYLAIYTSVDRNLKVIRPRTDAPSTPATDNVAAVAQPAMSPPILFWLREALLRAPLLSLFR